MLSCTLCYFIPRLTDEDESLYLAIKILNPFIVFALLVIASSDQDGGLCHGTDSLNGGIRIRSLRIVVIIYPVLRSDEFNPVFHGLKLADRFIS